MCLTTEKKYSFLTQSSVGKKFRDVISPGVLFAWCVWWHNVFFRHHPLRRPDTPYWTCLHQFYFWLQMSRATSWTTHPSSGPLQTRRQLNSVIVWLNKNTTRCLYPLCSEVSPAKSLMLLLLFASKVSKFAAIIVQSVVDVCEGARVCKWLCVTVRVISSGEEKTVPKTRILTIFHR